MTKWEIERNPIVNDTVNPSTLTLMGGVGSITNNQSSQESTITGITNHFPEGTLKVNALSPPIKRHEAG